MSSKEQVSQLLVHYFVCTSVGMRLYDDCVMILHCTHWLEMEIYISYLRCSLKLVEGLKTRLI